MNIQLCQFLIIVLCNTIRDKFIGIYNGLDDTLWDPALDSALPETYSLEKMAGKSFCKAMLRQELGLPMVDDSVPLVSICLHTFLRCG